MAKEKEKKDFAKKVLNTIPYKKILPDDIFFLGKKMYSKAYTFDDINFNLSDEEQQYMYLERYIEFLSILDDTVDCQICCWNSQINLDDFKKKTLLPQKADDLFEYRYEFNSRVLEENIRKGQNAIQKHMYITLTIKAPDEETARRRFKSLDITATNTFNRIGNTNMRVLTSQERVEMLKDFFVGTDDMPVPQLTEKVFAKGIDKLYCAPDYFDFKKDYFMFNNTYAKTIYIREYPSTATSEILTELLATGIEIMVTTNIETYDSAEARKLVQHQITAIDTDMAKREVKAAQHGNFSNQMPQRIKNQRDAMVSVYDKITMKDQKLFMTNMQILIKAESYEELNNNLEVIESTLKRSGCIKGEMAWEQEHGMCDCLPIGYQRKFGWMRTMPSESVAIFMPFNVKEMQMENSVYYGLNMLSHNIILFDRMKGPVNPSGFVLACPGSGKSFTVKREIVNVFLGYEDADILVIDPEREYWKLAEAFGGEVVKFSNGSKNHINPFDFDFRLLEDEEIDIIADKCQLLTSFISCMDSKHPLSAQEKSFVDSCVRKAYAKSNVLTTLDPKDMPTLGTFLECMKEENENINKDMKDKLIITVDMYVNGSAKYFDNQTNVNTKPASDTKAFVRPNNSKPSPHNRNAVENCDNNSSVISPEMAQRMQRAAYIQQMNNEKISQNISSAEYIGAEESVSTKSEKTVESVTEAVQKKSNNIASEKGNSAKSEISEHKSSISPEMAQRMKRAAFLAQQNKEAIQLNRAAVVNDEAEAFHDGSENSSKNTTADIPKKTDNSERKPFDSRFLSLKSDNSDDMTASEKLKFKVNIAKAEFVEKFKDSINTNRRNDLGVRYLDEHRKEGYKYDTVSEAVNDGAAFNVTPDQIRELDGGGHTLMDKALQINDYSVYNPDNPEYHKGRNSADGDYIGKAVQIGKTVQNSSSVGSAVTDVATTLAAVEAKKLVAKIMKGENAAKDRAFIEEHKAQGRTKYVDAEKERYKVEHKLSEKESVPEEISREERRNFLHNRRVAEKQKSFYAERLQTERKNKQKEMFLDFNKDNPNLVSNTAKGTGKLFTKKKASTALIGGGALAAIIPVIIIIIVFAVIAAFFGWLVPYSYSLAGEDGDETEAATNAEVIDGYAKLIKNYMDVTQAYYYLNYGDWYGGTYNYPSPDISFPEFFSEYCQSIVSEIQSYYYDLIAAAPNVNQKNALIDAMNNAISTAISNAMPAALAEYNAIMASLDDTLTAETHRQHYETEQQNMANGNADSAEFTGMPVVGTNHFGNVEINSELSTEELLAYIALYKSMSIINPDDSDPDAEQILNITPQDIMDFFEETEFITITTDVTHGNFCSGMNCKRRLVDEAWEYYCDGDHDNLTGEIGACKTADELREKVMEITNAEENGVDEDSFNKLIEEYMKLIEKELDITEADYRKFGAADNTTAQEFYSILIGDEEIPNNFWNVETPIG